MNKIPFLHNKDELSFVLKNYSNIIKDNLGLDIGISFSTDSEDYIDTYISLQNKLNYDCFNITFFNNFMASKDFITDIGLCSIKDKNDKKYNFIKIVTPFTRERSYDFILTKTSETKNILDILKDKEKKFNFKLNTFPIMGIDFEDIKKNSIDFLMNEDFRTYCISKYIKLKRGIVLEGKPGSGKCCHKDVKVKVRINKEDIDITMEKLFDFMGYHNQGDYFPVINIEIDTPYGWKKINYFKITQENPEWIIETENGKSGIFADHHLFETMYEGSFDENNGKKWSKCNSLKVGDEINTRYGFSKIKNIYHNGKYSNMYDIEVNEVKCYFSNDIVSHNTMTIQYIKNIALENDIDFYSFKNAEDFMKNYSHYEKEDKKIFVFEDFDTILRERKNTNNTPNQILGMILNILEGVDEINNVVSIFTTNEVRLFDSAFIRPGRIDKVYTYNLPNINIYKDFFSLYIPEDYIFHSHIEEMLSVSNTDISFAVLKGICDDINIFKFSDEKLTKQKIDNIIKEKLLSINKQEIVKNAKEYVL